MTLRPRDRIAIAVVLTLALAGAFYVLALKPEQKKASTLSTAIASQRTALATAQSTYAAGKAAQATVKAGAPQLAALRKAVPNLSDIPALLRVLEHNANAVHVKLTTIALSGATSSASGPSAPTTPSAGGAAKTGSGASAATGAGGASAATGAGGASAATGAGGASAATGASGTSAATSLPVALTFTGGYTDLHNFVRRLDRLVVVSAGKVHATGPLLSISNISLSGAPKLTVQLTAAIYQLSAPLAAAAAPTGGHP